MKESIFETLEDEKGNVDFRRAGGMSKRNILRQFETILVRESKRQNNTEFSKQVEQPPSAYLFRLRFRVSAYHFDSLALSNNTQVIS